MCLAEDMKMKIFYQDTDSMHLINRDIPNLAKEFLLKYQRELIGKSLGQFHSDFESDLLGKEKQIYSTMFIALGKKCYIDQLENGSSNNGVLYQDYHI